jgi:hypothetical protein
MCEKLVLRFILISFQGSIEDGLEVGLGEGRVRWGNLSHLVTGNLFVGKVGKAAGARQNGIDVQPRALSHWSDRPRTA